MPGWIHRVLLDALDITAEVGGEPFSVEEAEQESAIFDFRWRPAGGQMPGLSLKAVVLDVDMGAGFVRLFSGVIIRAEWEEAHDEYVVRASNRLQEYFRALGSNANVEAALAGIGVLANADFFGDPPDDLWEYALQLLETAPYDAHLDRSGVLQLIPWAAKGVADHSFDASDVDESSWEEADTEAKPNQIILELGLAFQRWKIRSHTVSWTASLAPHWSTLCDWIQGINGAYWPPPILSEATATMLGGAWDTPRGVSMEQLPFGVPDLCFQGQPPLDWAFDQSSHPLTFAAATGYRALECGIQESYTLTLNALGAQTLYGAITSQRHQVGIVMESNAVWPPSAVDDTVLGTGIFDSAGDEIEDQIDEARRVAFLDAAYAWGRTKLLSGNRADSRRLRVLMNPAIQLADTVAFNYAGALITGKVRRLRHTFTPLRTEITLAVSRGGGADDVYATPTRPASTDSVGYWEAIEGPGTYPMPSAGHAVPTHIGSRTDSPTKDTYAPDEEGFFTNAVNYPGFGGDPDQIYDRIFRVHWPAQEEQATADMAFAASQSFEIATPSDY